MTKETTVTAAANNTLAYRPPVSCPVCRNTVFDGIVITARCVRVLPRGAEAKCKRCKQWVRVPVSYAA
jgi:hypothetical protein